MQSFRDGVGKGGDSFELDRPFGPNDVVSQQVFSPQFRPMQRIGSRYYQIGGTTSSFNIILSIKSNKGWESRMVDCCAEGGWRGIIELS